ncbi:GntR family transcriptional regulator [Paenibacillus sp. AR247]|uniref:GntR family transcriptional regulator n=2 Tax=unclassified Paenibacillus TaxID=185978 RepID=UPI000CF870A6|nr:GntR family transcriptional regulator [Paenibacillus sp. AR247]PQP87159.1 hypothetical protein CPT76_26670 [Paenibacillus sp. AR247]
MYATLAALHSLAAETAATHISAEQIEQLKGLNADFATAIKQGQPYQAMELDEQFHNLIVDASDNAYAASFSASLQIHIRRFKYVFLAQPVAATAASVEEHARIIEAFEKKDAALAASVMKQNLLRPMKELYAFIQNHSEGDDSK